MTDYDKLKDVDAWLLAKTGPSPCYTDEHIEVLWDEILEFRKLRETISWDANKICELTAKIAKQNATIAKYNDLIMQVQQKHPDETRHETARRYIRQRENQNNPPASAALLEADDDSN